ncbi:MAG: peptidoglycan DD-metalloendopeptidase family protein [Methyloceanibacter sp.]
MTGCSSGVSRFDIPAFGLTDSGSTSGTDQTTTASLPVPSEPVYNPDRYHYYGDGSQQPGGGQLARSSLPSPGGSTAYSPAPSVQPAAYPAPKMPRPAPAVVRSGRPADGAPIKVSSGDTLSSLSRQHGVSVEQIMSANNLPDARLRAGQEIVIPGAKRARVAAAAPSQMPLSAAAPEPSPAPPPIAAKEPAAQPYAAEAEGSSPSSVRKVKTTTVMRPDEETPPPGEMPFKPEEAPPPPAEPDVTGAGSQSASVDQLPSPDPMSGNSFRWPVRGRIIADFGTKPDGGHNDGINVSVPQGTSVKAAENGVVAYAGSELKGYGNLVLVRHSNHWVSAYAHNEQILVKRGDKVRRGQIIAKAGNSGSVSQPQVHFELRKGSRPVDPTKYMSDASASAD